ncbi:MAG: HPr(Ser) kinase/phosphatase [Gammaproteobacteria bacterium]|nr:MAG: HPr(Ser) kinase/phosphatase [Gammaproteobacteria bacterium]
MVRTTIDMTPRTALTAGNVFESHKERLKLHWAAGKSGDERSLEAPDARWSGMALVGYLNTVHANRVQIIGTEELDYLNKLDKQHLSSTVSRIFHQPRTALIIISDDMDVPQNLLQIADEAGMPLIVSQLPAPELIYHLQFYLARALSPKSSMHGVLLSVMGHGVLITGESGVGKSELALELIAKGHHLVADDAITIRRTSPEHLEGYCNPKFNHFLEVRGLGILNIREMYGKAAMRLTKRIELIVNLQSMDPQRLSTMDRLHQENSYRNILGIQIPEITVPVTSGRNLSVMIEAAVRNQILVSRGYNAVEDFITIQQDVINSTTR